MLQHPSIPCPYTITRSTCPAPPPKRRQPRALQEILRSRKAQVPATQAVTCFGVKYEVAGIFYLGYILGALCGRLPGLGRFAHFNGYMLQGCSRGDPECVSSMAQDAASVTQPQVFVSRLRVLACSKAVSLMSRYLQKEGSCHCGRTPLLTRAQ
jgi:hypothetical protein